MALVKGSQNTVWRNSPTRQLTYKRKKYIFIPPSLNLHLHQLISLCDKETWNQVEWCCVWGNGMPVSEQPNAERARVLVLSFNSVPLLRTDNTPMLCAYHASHLCKPWKRFSAKEVKWSFTGLWENEMWPLYQNFSSHAKGQRSKEGREDKQICAQGHSLTLIHVLLTLLKWLTEHTFSHQKNYLS